MRHTTPLVLALVAGLSGSLFAQEGKTAPAGQPQTVTLQPGQPTPPPPPAPVPVPDGPVVKTTDLGDGLIAEDIKIGDGYEVKAGGAVVAHYHGTLKNGTPGPDNTPGNADDIPAGKVFDSSFQRGDPAMFPLSGVIAGWQKGVPGMKVGGIRRLIIPAAMAYGARGSGQAVPPNSDLIFVIELVDALQIEDIKEGEGEAISGQFVAVTSHVIKDKDGKELEKVDASKPYIWFPGEYPPIAFGLEGMKPGGKRKLTVPKKMAQASPMGPAHPKDQDLVIEVELMVSRNLQPRR